MGIAVRSKSIDKITLTCMRRFGVTFLQGGCGINGLFGIKYGSVCVKFKM